MNNRDKQNRSVKALLELYQELRSAEHSRETDFETLNKLDATIEAIESGDACPLPRTDLVYFALSTGDLIDRITGSG